MMTDSVVKKAKKSKDSTLVHPKYKDMIRESIINMRDRKGSSRQAIVKYIMSTYNVGTNTKVINSHVKTTLRLGASDGSLRQMKGCGASGSFRVTAPQKSNKPTKTVAVKKKVIGTAKKNKPAKKAAEKKTKVKATSSKPKTRSPKKTKSKPSPKKPKSPKAVTPKKSIKVKKPVKKTTKKK